MNAVPLNNQKNIKSRLIFYIKLVFSLALCSFILWKGDWENIWKSLKSSNPILILLVFSCMVLCVTISTYKWQRILSIHSIKFDFAKLHQYYLTALFFNNFLPSNIGGDTYRVYKTWKNPISKAAALMAVIFERITGIWALILFGFIGSVVIYLQKPLSIPHFDVIVAVLALAVIGPAIAFLMSDRLKFLLQIKFIPGKIIKLFQILNDYRQNAKDTLQIIFISFFFHIFTFFWMMLLIKSIGTGCSIFSLALAVTISNLVAILPISLNGIGLLDGSFIFVMGMLGMEYEFSLMFMLIIRLFTLLISLSGIFFYLREKRSGDIRNFQPDEIRSLKESVL